MVSNLVFSWKYHVLEGLGKRVVPTVVVAVVGVVEERRGNGRDELGKL